MAETTWEKLSQQIKQLGDITLDNDEIVLRGPLKEISIEGDSLVIECHWLAYPVSHSAWKKTGQTKTKLPFKERELLKDYREGIVFRVGKTFGAIHRHDGPRLDPSKVEGLVL